jgi:hypothetical protein
MAPADTSLPHSQNEKCRLCMQVNPVAERHAAVGSVPSYLLLGKPGEPGARAKQPSIFACSDATNTSIRCQLDTSEWQFLCEEAGPVFSGNPSFRLPWRPWWCRLACIPRSYACCPLICMKSIVSMVLQIPSRTLWQSSQPYL